VPQRQHCFRRRIPDKSGRWDEQLNEFSVIGLYLDEAEGCVAQLAAQVLRGIFFRVLLEIIIKAVGKEEYCIHRIDWVVKLEV